MGTGSGEHIWGNEARGIERSGKLDTFLANAAIQTVAPRWCRVRGAWRKVVREPGSDAEKKPSGGRPAEPP